jgi:DNA-binding response OmpR family regulator
MSTTHGYILVLDTQRHQSGSVETLLAQLRWPVFVAGSAEQAVAQAHQISPWLVILIGDGQNWSKSLVEQLRQGSQPKQMTIVALTESTSPRWDHTDDHPGLDGFFVKPLSSEVLTSLVQSALAKQNWI